MSGKVKRYSVMEKHVIEDTDWSFLEGTEENVITLITCVEDMPNLRRAVQAKEI
jgi:LPXTG-site transpeptidase (sortase) family protein